MAPYAVYVSVMALPETFLNSLARLGEVCAECFVLSPARGGATGGIDVP